MNNSCTIKACKKTFTTILNKENHQYSERLARPVKVTYFLKQVEMDCVNDIIDLSLALLGNFIPQYSQNTLSLAISLPHFEHFITKANNIHIHVPCV